MYKVLESNKGRYYLHSEKCIIRAKQKLATAKRECVDSALTQQIYKECSLTCVSQEELKSHIKIQMY